MIDDGPTLEPGEDTPTRAERPARAGRIGASPREPVGPARTRGLEGRVALVTGADDGIGRAVALRFAREGARVALMRAPGAGPSSGGRRVPAPSEALERVRGEVELAGGRVMTAGGDPSDLECALEAVRRVVGAWGAIDELVLDSTVHRESSTAALVGAARPYLGKGASLASVVRDPRRDPLRVPRRADALGGTVLVEHASIRAARSGFARSALAGLAREGILADGAGTFDARSAFERLRPSTGALPGFGRHVLSLRDGRPEAIAACLLHLALVDADWG